ncbi:MAG: CRISPR-associated endonuclease Cas1 [Deltaproteobacteria bacterium]|nr:CRISPR-associated endonuclease Cas1 [Deltaproteobacteria bacterium]
MLNEYAYCARLGVLMWVHDLFAESGDTVDGTRRHKRVDKPGPELPIPAPAPAADELDFSGGAADEAAPVELVTRSVWLSAPRERLTCKIDILELADGEAVPVDVKRGHAPDVPEGAWEPERIQLCAQGLVLREHGLRVERGQIYFASSKRRVDVVFDEALVARTRALVRDLLAAAEQESLPPPLVDSPKCPRCSLVGICLPDETRMLSEAQAELPLEPARQILVPDPGTMPLYVDTQGTRVGVNQGELVVWERDKELGRVRIAETSHVAVMGNVQVTSQAMGALMREEVPVCYFTYGGWFSGIARGLTHKHVHLRRAQFRAAEDPGASLAIARAIVRSKIRNQRTLLRRNADGVDDLTLREMARLSEASARAESAATLLGLEGAAARLYFGSWPKMVRKRELGFDFESRNRRPPRDPINSLLSFAYAMLTKDAVVVLEAVGFDPFLGFYHQPRYGKPALALDLIEELRPLVADSAVLMAVNNGEVGATSFVRRADGCNLTQAGRRAFIAAYERRMDQVIQHPLFGYKASWRRVMEVQARLLGRHLQGEIPRYVPIETR